jgi:ABC-type branched-subunit amino acid transport system substrate-binding protein
MRLAWVMAVLALIGCAPQVRQQAARPRAPAAQAWQAPVMAPPAAAAAVARQRVGLLLPLSGPNAALGHSMLNAAQLALFDQSDTMIEFLPRDTRSSAAGALEAARAAIGDGAGVLIGPLTLGETAAAAGPAQAASVPMLSFTSDESQAGNGVWVLGVTPAQVARRLASVAVSGGQRRIGLLGADDEFGRRLVAALRSILAEAGLPAPVVMLTRPGSDAGQNGRDFTARLAAEGGVDALILSQAGTAARQAVQGLVAAGLAPMPRLFGTHLWAGDGQIAQESVLAGAGFTGPDPAARNSFDNRFLENFGERPARLAGTAYDAAALAARAAREGGRALPIGMAFQGADGPIRLMADGVLGRGLAILEFQNGQAVLRDAAPIPGGPGS